MKKERNIKIYFIVISLKVSGQKYKWNLKKFDLNPALVL